MTSKSSIDAEASSRKPEGQSVRVVVRVRPLTSTDTGGTCSALSINPNGQHVQLSAPHDKRTTRQFSFDAALDQHISQEDMYSTSGVQGLVDAAAQGYHSTIFAYGQTGSGKTFTMEGFKYTMPSGNSGATAAKARAPTADFQNTPQHQLGIIPRAIAALFQALNSDTSRRSVVRCSYVQIYKEQAYDLLNPTSILSAMGPQHHNKQQQQGPGGASGALRMRWSKAEDFYLENLFKVECNSAEEALFLFRSGVQNKVMASHKLNASSSRSHCLLTLYIDSSPLSSPTEIISSRLTLVDLAGSERGSSIGATSEGKLRDESVAINKSLFTLRQVITCLAAASSQQQGGTTPSSHVPYRDSKLTSLLKNSLGGTSLTLMVACLAPSDAFYEENLSTLEYASKAARITNQVSLNEDAKTRLIRELRTEVAFLRQQLAAVQMGDYVKLTGPGPNGMLPGQQPARGATQIPRPPGITSAASTQSAASTLGVPSGLSAGASAAPGPSLEEMKQKLLESTQHDVGIMVEKLLDAISLVQSLAAVNQQLRTAYDQVSKHSEALRIDNDSLMIENAELRDRLSFVEGMAGIADPSEGQQLRGPHSPKRGLTATHERQQAGIGIVGQSNHHQAVVKTPAKSSVVSSTSAPSAGPSPASSQAIAGINNSNVQPPVAVFTASNAALIELQELRRENALLHERMSRMMMTSSSGPKANNSPAKMNRPPGQPSQPRFVGRSVVPGRASGSTGTGAVNNTPPVLTPFTPAALRQSFTSMPPLSAMGAGASISAADMRTNQSNSRPGVATLPTAGQRPSSDPVSSMQPGTASSRNQAMVSSQPPPTSGLQHTLSSSGPSQRIEHSFQRTPSDSMISVANASFSGMPSSHAVGPWKGSGSVLSSQNSGGGQVMATEDPAAKMIQLMVQRNAMARATIIGQDAQEIPQSPFNTLIRSPASSTNNAQPVKEVLRIV